MGMDTIVTVWCSSSSGSMNSHRDVGVMASTPQDSSPALSTTTSPAPKRSKSVSFKLGPSSSTSVPVDTGYTTMPYEHYVKAFVTRHKFAVLVAVLLLTVRLGLDIGKVC